MLTQIENQLFDRMQGAIRYVSPVAPGEAEGVTREVYRQLRREFQLAPPLTLQSPSSELLAGAWSVLREVEIVQGALTRPEKEAIAGAVSQRNLCPYCVDAHTGLLEAATRSGDGRAVRGANPDAIEDVRMRGLVTWALATRNPDDPVIWKPPFSSEQAPEAIGTALFYHYTNRMVQVFLGDALLPVPSAFRSVVRTVYSATFARRMVERSGEPGESLALLPEADLPSDLAWAESRPTIGSAWARFASAAEAAGVRSLPDSVRAAVTARLEQWHGEDLDLSGAWLDHALEEVREADHSFARLAFLSAFAPYRVDEAVVDAFRQEDPSDRGLVEAVAWSSWTAARRIGRWLSPQS